MNPIDQEKLQQDRVLLEQLEARYKLLSLITEEQQLAEENKDLSSSCLAYTLVSPPKPVINSIIQVCRGTNNDDILTPKSEHATFRSL